MSQKIILKNYLFILFRFCRLENKHITADYYVNTGCIFTISNFGKFQSCQEITAKYMY